MKSSCRPLKTTITDLRIIERLCRVQQDFVAAWNEAECNGGIDQTHDLPGNAIYGFQHCGAVFYIGEKVDGAYQTRVHLYCKKGWFHWHEGWSFCRNSISVDQLRKVDVVGSLEVFHDWIDQLAAV